MAFSIHRVLDPSRTPSYSPVSLYFSASNHFSNLRKTCTQESQHCRFHLLVQSPPASLDVCAAASRAIRNSETLRGHVTHVSKHHQCFCRSGATLLHTEYALLSSNVSSSPRGQYLFSLNASRNAPNKPDRSSVTQRTPQHHSSRSGAPWSYPNSLQLPSNRWRRQDSAIRRNWEPTGLRRSSQVAPLVQ